MLILGTAFALHGVYPFGDRQILVTDFWQQYYPFISDYWHKLRGGHSLIWSWTAGAGHDYVAHIAYYMASPFNLLAALFPHTLLREVLTFFLLVKIGCAGLFMSMYLRYATGRCDILLPVFSAAYALCAFVLGYYWNIMWMDTFALLPLVMLGVHRLINEGAFKLYIGSLAAAMIFNFYIGFFVCVFVALYFFVLCTLQKWSVRDFAVKVALMFICSVLALSMTAFLTLPTYAALRHTAIYGSAFPDSISLLSSFTSVLGNFIAFTPPTSMVGLPNLYSGMMSIMLLPVFLLLPRKEVGFAQKMAYLAVAVFLVVSTNVNVLDYIWHGFSHTNMLPQRFTFLASFILIVMAYRACVLMGEDTRDEDCEESDEGKKSHVLVSCLSLLAMGVVAAIFLALAFIGEQDNRYVLWSGILAGVYLVLFAGKMFLARRTETISRNRLSIFLKGAIFVIILTELSITTYLGVQSVRTTDRVSFPSQYAEIQQLLTYRQTAENDFQRTELNRWLSLNDSSLYSFNGISFFSSMANVNVTNFIEGIGLPGWDRGNRFYYAETSPLTNAFLNIRYMIVRDATTTDSSDFWNEIAAVDDALLLQNQRHLPLGFMVNFAMLEFEGRARNPFDIQNDLFGRATRLSGELFTVVDIIHVGHRDYDVRRRGLGDYTFTLDEDAENGMFRFNYEMPESGCLYVFTRISDTNDVRVSVDRTTLREFDVRRPYIFRAGSFEAGTLVSIEADSDTAHGSIQIWVALFDHALFEQGFDILAAEALQLNYFSDTRIVGEISVSEGGLLYTSIPNDGNWSAYVNGVEVNIITIGGAMVGIWLEPGEHIVEFRYHNRYLVAGVGISGVAFLIFATLIAWAQLKKDSGQETDNVISPPSTPEIISYLIVGGATTFVNWAIYAIAVQFAGITTSNIVAWSIAVIFAFIANKIWVFKSRQWKITLVRNEAGLFLSGRIFTGLIEMVGVPLLFFVGLNYPLFGVEGFAAKVAVSVFVVVLNYIFSKLIVFRSLE